MNAARLATSARLQRVHGLLSDGIWHTTLEIASAAHVCAVNSAVAELRANGAAIECRVKTLIGGARRWEYRMLRPAPGEGG